MTKAQKIVKITIAAFTGAIIIFDIILAVAVPEATISKVMKTLGHNYPIIPFCVGGLVAHFWWPVKEKKK